MNMASFFGKISTLIKARVENFLEEDLHLPQNRDRREVLSSERLGKGIDGEIAVLRQRIDEAIDYEESLEMEIDALRQEASDWDMRADNALSAGNDASARQALSQMKQAEQRARMLEADLHQHRRTTAEFIERVNVLEGLVAEARREQAAGDQSVEPSRTLDTVLQETRAEVDSLDETAAPPVDTRQDLPDEKQDRDDLATRRARLSKREASQEEE